MATSGSQLTRIGAFFSGIAKKLTITAKTEGVTPEPASFAVQSVINSDGLSVNSIVKAAGISVQSSISSSFAVLSTITTDGASARSEINSSGISVRSNMQG